MYKAMENFSQTFFLNKIHSPPPSMILMRVFFVTLVSLKRNKRLCVLPKLLISILTNSSFTLIEWKVDRFLLDYHIAIIDKGNKTLPHQGNCR